MQRCMRGHMVLLCLLLAVPGVAQHLPETKEFAVTGVVVGA